MNYLIDTHVFIWMNDDLSNLTSTVQNLVSDEANTLILSVVSVWEIQIKLKVGKFTFKRSISEMLTLVQKQNQVEILPVSLPHVLRIADLPLHHKDPFDRLLIAQAIVEGYTLISKDDIFEQYPVSVLW